MSLWKISFIQNTNENISGILPWNFCSFLGAFWKLFGLPGDLVSNIINKEGYRKLKKLPGSPQEAQGRNFRNIFVGILDKTDFSLGHFEINWPLISASVQYKCGFTYYTKNHKWSLIFWYFVSNAPLESSHISTLEIFWSHCEAFL